MFLVFHFVIANIHDCVAVLLTGVVSHHDCHHPPPLGRSCSRQGLGGVGRKSQGQGTESCPE